MKKYIKNIGTTGTTATFIVIGVTGLMLFFGMKSMSAKLIHEWVGVIMVGVVILHIMANFSPFKSYFKGRKLIAILLILAFSVFGFFMLNSKNNAKPPLKVINKEILQKTPAQICEFFAKDCGGINKFLADKKINPNKAISQISKENAINENQILGLIFSNKKH